MSCGYNEHGQLGHGDTLVRTTFEEIKGIPRNISEVVCGIANTFIRLTCGKILSCGYNVNGQLGHGDKINKSRFEEIEFDFNSAKCV